LAETGAVTLDDDLIAAPPAEVLAGGGGAASVPDAVSTLLLLGLGLVGLSMFRPRRFSLN
jgi:hypothetical protein